LPIENISKSCSLYAHFILACSRRKPGIPWRSRTCVIAVAAFAIELLAKIGHAIAR
jgi:hypothetical protein